MENQHTRELNDKEEEQQQGESSSKRCSEPTETASSQTLSRKEKRKANKKRKRKQVRREIAERERERENDPEVIKREEEREKEERERCAREVREFEERERKWLEELEVKKRIEEEQMLKKKVLEQHKDRAKVAEEYSDDDNWEYVEEGPAEIIWQGNEIIVRKKKVRVPKKYADDANRPTSNPLPPQSEVFSDYMSASSVPAQEALGNVAQQVPNFGTELDKAHCPFHLKTGACRFGQRCSRVHFYPDKSCTLLIKNMYNGPGLAWEQDEGLEYTDEEVERSFEEFYEDVHTEFLKFGEIVNFKVCKNGSPHLRGNVYVHYKSLESAVLAYQSFNGRYYAGKQLKCEFVNISRWKVAICGEYIKSRLQTCSRGTACNFIHCFRNPGGDYEWADWDKPAPRFWLRKMTALFGYSDSPESEKLTDKNMGQGNSSVKKKTSETDRYRSRRSRSRELDSLNGSSHRRHSDGQDDRNNSTHWRGRAADEELLDRDRDGYCSHIRKSSKHRKEGNGFLDKRKIQEADSDKDLRHRHGERGSHYRRGRKSSECHGKEYVDEDDKEDKAGRLSNDGDRDRHHNRNRRISRRHSESQYQDEVEGKRGSHCHSVGGQSELDGDRDRDGHYTRRRKRSKSRDKHYEFLDDNEGMKSTSESYSSDDQSERSMERPHQNSRKSSKNSDELGHQDDDEDCKKREHDIDYLEEQLDEYSARDRHHRHRWKISKQQNSPDTYSCEQLDEYSDRDGHHSHRRKSSKHGSVVDSHHGSKRKALDFDIIYDRRHSERDRDRERRHHSHKRKHSTHWDEDGALKKNKGSFGTQESDIVKLNVEGSQSCGHPSISPSSMNNNKADLFVDCTKLNKDHESTSVGHIGERYALEYNDEDCYMGRWQPESPIELYH